MARALKQAAGMDAVACGREVLAQEIAGLSALKTALDKPFAQAVETIARVCAAGGRLIVSGMGKSGHVGHKIASTMASTGTPAHFVHPAEASHGDLGMITGSDCVLVLSNSGETKELTDIVAFSKREGAALIAMVRRADSMLAKAADVALVLPESPEASPVNAPTTSTTMMMALGDALAVALLKARGFTSEDFGKLHPGGRLGSAFLRVSDLMHASPLPLVKENTLISDALLEMTKGRFGCTGVVDKAGRLAGIITDGDLRRHMASNLLSRKASGIMTAKPKTIRPDALATEALQLMNSKSITSLFVLDGGKPVGILHVHDCLRAGIV